MRRRLRRGVGAIAAALTLLVTSSCFGGGGTDPNVLLVASVSGPVQARASDGGWTTLAQGARLGAGAAIRVARGGSVALNRGDDSAVEVRPNGDRPAEISIMQPDRLNVASGDVLVVSRRVAPIAVESGGIAAMGTDAVYRFDRRLSVRVGVYEGSAVVQAAGGSLDVPPLRQGIVSARLLPRATRPLVVDPEDPWDVRFLGDVIELEAELLAQHRGFEAEYGRRTTVRELERFYRASLGLGRLSFVRPHLGSLGHGDVLTALVLTSLIRQRDGGGAADVIFEQVVALLEQGAGWGVIARTLGVDGNELLAGVVRAIGLRTGEVRPGPITGGGGSGGGGSGGGGSGGGSGGGGGGGGGGSPTPTPSPSPTRSDPPSPSPSPTPTETQSPSPSPSPSCFPLPPELCPPGV